MNNPIEDLTLVWKSKHHYGAEVALVQTRMSGMKSTSKCKS